MVLRFGSDLRVKADERQTTLSFQHLYQVIITLPGGLEPWNKFLEVILYNNDSLQTL